LTQPLDGLLEVVGPAFGQRQRRVGHTSQLHPLLRSGGGYGALKVASRRLGVVALGGPRAEDRQSGGLELGLGLQLLVGERLQAGHGLCRAALLDADLSLLGHGGPRV
jgi:hypothetical protein